MKNIKLFSSLFVLFSIFSCTQDDITESTSTNTQKDYKQEIISFEDFLRLESHNSEISKLDKYYISKEVDFNENDTLFTGRQFKNDFNDNWSIDTTKVSKIVIKDLTIYTFAIKEYKPIEGFRNLIVKKQNGITTNHIIHYPDGVDFENHRPRKAIFKDLDSKIQARSQKGEVCYSVVIDLVYDCASGACKYGWHLEEKPCGADGGSSSGDDSGSGNGSNSGGAGFGSNSASGDNNNSGSGSSSGGGSNPGNNFPVYPLRGQYTDQAERLSSILQLRSINHKRWLSDNMRISNIMLEILGVDSSYQTKQQTIWLINYFIKNTRAKRHFEQNPKDLEVLYVLGVDFFSRNPNVSWEDLKYLLHNKTSYESSLGDLDNNTLGGYDNTIYPDFDFQTQGWPNISPIISKNDFIGWGYPNIKRNCMDYAKAQIAVKGYVISNYSDSGQTFQIYTSNNGINSSELSKGVSYLKYALTNNIPVIVGVDFKSGSPNPGTDNTTDHFVVIVGMGSDSKGMYLIFYDNAVGDSNGGANINNRLYYNSTTKKFQGQSQSTYGVDKIYTITMIRKSKKK